MYVTYEGYRTPLFDKRKGWTPNWEYVVGDIYCFTIYLIPVMLGYLFGSWRLFILSLIVISILCLAVTLRVISLIIRLTGRIMRVRCNTTNFGPT